LCDNAAARTLLPKRKEAGKERRMKRVIIGVLAFALPAEASLACSQFWRPFGETLDRESLVVRAKPAFRFTRNERSVEGYKSMAGTAILTIEKCIKRPKFAKACPKTVSVAFDFVEDGSNCEHPLFEGSHHNWNNRYFSLRRTDDRWSVSNAAKTLWGNR
jgi:hypothetical protein